MKATILILLALLPGAPSQYAQDLMVGSGSGSLTGAMAEFAKSDRATRPSEHFEAQPKT